jgi:solute carrier family 44 (choline transporter-like protein), member 1
MKFINYNAYTIIAIEGNSFCTSAQKAFSIIVENSLRVATINSVGDFMLFLSKIAVTAINLLLAIMFLEVPTDNVI